jgi:hypothetical protein
VCGRQYFNDMKMSVAKRLEIRTIITFGAYIGKTPTDSYNELGQVQCHEDLFFKWRKRERERVGRR